jgi:two-component system, LuxR family, response regulator FixJ
LNGVAVTPVRDLVCVVDDDAAATDAVRAMLRGLPVEVLVFGSAGALLQHRDALTRTACFILSATMRGVGGLMLQESLFAIGNRAVVLFLSGPCEVTQAVQALRAGAIDFMIKPVAAERLCRRVADALELFHAQRVRRARIHALNECLAGLSGREREVLEHVMEGRQNTRIATALGISAKTVEQHRARMMAKMKAASLAELVARVTEWRLLSNSMPETASTRARI